MVTLFPIAVIYIIGPIRHQGNRVKKCVLTAAARDGDGNMRSGRKNARCAVKQDEKKKKVKKDEINR
jgi:hypothetical protein